MAHKKWFWFSLTFTIFAQAWLLRPSLAATEAHSECEGALTQEANRVPAITGSAILSSEFVSWAAGFETQLSSAMQ